MNIIISAKKMTIPQSFHEYAKEKLTFKLGKFFGDEAKVKLTISEFKNLIIIELTVTYNNMIYRSEQTAEHKNDALDSAIDKIIRQIRKNKTKIEKKLKDNAFKETYVDKVDDVSNYQIIKHKKFELRAMNLDEAILQMNMIGHNFFMFLDASTGNTHVVYKRNDGNYAVLEPERD
jgi:putative sigma-54 modulation protein